MTEVFADTFYWLALLNVDDAHHGKVSKHTVSGKLVTTWAVQFEVMDALSEQRYRPLALLFWNETQNDASLVVECLDVALLAEAVSLFSARKDKNWSFTDCVSFVVMNRRGIMEALTADRHFEQAGFRAIFREP